MKAILLTCLLYRKGHRSTSVERRTLSGQTNLRSQNGIQVLRAHLVLAVCASKAFRALASPQSTDAVARAVVEVKAGVCGDDLVGDAASAAQRWRNGDELARLGDPEREQVVCLFEADLNAHHQVTLTRHQYGVFTGL